MANRKTSKKQKPFSLNSLPAKELKAGAKVKSHDPVANLSDAFAIRAALAECLMSGDVEAFKEIIKAHYAAVNTTKALKKAGLSARTFYDSLKPSGNPSLKTAMKMVQGLRAD